MADQLTDDGLGSLLGKPDADQPQEEQNTAVGHVETDLKKMVVGRVDTFVNTILSFTAEAKYDIAIRELRIYQDIKNQLNVFKFRTERYFDHCEELIRAVQTKKSFPNFTQLPMSKQEEIHEMVHAHFDDLRRSLKQIQKVEADIQMDDVRSTVWVIKALVISVLVLSVIAIVGQAARTMVLPFKVMQDDATEAMTSGIDKFLNMLGL
jgi:hypothetical protein